MSLDVLVGSIKSSLPSHALVKVRHSHFFCGYKKASKDSCLVNGIKLDTDTALICVSSQLSQFKCQIIDEHDEKITWAVLLASTPRSPTTPTSIAITPSKLCTGLSALSLPPSFQMQPSQSLSQWRDPSSTTAGRRLSRNESVKAT